jgi:hypothetical protein
MHKVGHGVWPSTEQKTTSKAPGLASILYHKPSRDALHACKVTPQRFVRDGLESQSPKTVDHME